jgi:DNA excision repair protein ERCC-3
VEDFLVAIAEPENRPSHMHEYQMTMHSLYAAASMGLTFKRIVRQLQAWSKTMISPELEDWIKEQTGRYGKVKLVLRQDEHYVETAYKDVMRKLLKDDRVRKCREIGGDAATTSGVVTDTLDLHAKQFEEYADDDDAEDIYFETVETQEGLSRHKKKRKLEIERFAVAAGCYREIKKACLDLGYPLIEEYDYLNDRKPLRGVSWRESLSTESWRTGLQLRSVDNIRDYQAKCLNKMFGANRRARSGLIVLPCGAGKTFVGINAACTINKKTIILCPDGLSKNQWDYQFRIWTNMEKAQVTVEGFTSHELRELGTGEDALAEVRRMMTADIILTTYSAITAGRTDQIGKARKVMMEELEKYEFGLLIMDEVHILPAATFQKSLDKIKAHAKLGLTATLVREDNKIDDLRFLIGPKIFEANWLELQRAGYLARVECHEVQCPMTAEFYDGYLQAGISRLRKEMLYILNPSKIMAAHYLIQQHSQRGHKIIVFSDRIFPLHVLSQALLTWGLKDIGMIEGKCQAWERDQIIKDFKNNPKSHVILLSKVGDAALDMPDSNVIIQISASGGSRKQEAQRLGRILRPKSKMSYGDETQAWFYSLVSQDTVEMRYSTKRQQYLVDQGYAFHVNTPGEGGICALAVAESRAREQDGRRGLLFSKPERQQALLRRILQDTAEEDLDIQEDDDQKSLAKAERDRDGILPPSQRQKRNRPATKVNVDLSSNKKKIVSAVIKKKR